MLVKLVNFFNRRYPLNTNKRHHYILAMSIGFWVFLFLFFAEPCKIDRFTLEKKLWSLPIYGLIQSFCYVISYKYQVNGYKRNNAWSTKHEVTFHLILFLIAWTINFLFYRFFVTAHVNTYSLWAYTQFHFLPAATFVLPVIVLTRFFISDKTGCENTTIKIKGEGKLEILQIQKTSLVYVKSDNNYVEVFYQGENIPILKSRIIRSNLNDLLEAFPFLVKTHRSFLVNPECFVAFRRERQNLFCLLSHNTMVPVSRNRKKEITNLFRSHQIGNS